MLDMDTVVGLSLSMSNPPVSMMWGPTLAATYPTVACWGIGVKFIQVLFEPSNLQTEIHSFGYNVWLHVDSWSWLKEKREQKYMPSMPAMRCMVELKLSLFDNVCGWVITCESLYRNERNLILWLFTHRNLGVASLFKSRFPDKVFYKERNWIKQPFEHKIQYLIMTFPQNLPSTPCIKRKLFMTMGAALQNAKGISTVSSHDVQLPESCFTKYSLLAVSDVSYLSEQIINMDCTWAMVVFF